MKQLVGSDINDFKKIEFNSWVPTYFVVKWLNAPRRSESSVNTVLVTVENSEENRDQPAHQVHVLLL